MGTYNANIGTRATLTLAGSSYEDTFTFEPTAIRFSGCERASIDASHMGLADPIAAVVGNRIFIPGELISPGQLTIEGHFNANNVPPFFFTPGTGTTAVDMLTLSVPMGSSSNATWVGAGFLVSFDAEIPMEEMMTATLVWQFTGSIDADMVTGATVTTRPLTVTAGT